MRNIEVHVKNNVNTMQRQITLLLELLRTPIAECLVQALAVIEALDILGDEIGRAHV